jgi:hypothetical protein
MSPLGSRLGDQRQHHDHGVGANQQVAFRCSQPSAATLESRGPERTDLVRNVADGKMTAAQIGQVQQDHDRGNETRRGRPLPLMV